MNSKSSKQITDAKVKETTLLAHQLFENYEKKILDLNNQLRFIQIINSTLDLDQMVKALLFACQGNLLVSAVSIFLPVDLEVSAFAIADCVGYQRESFNIQIKSNTQLIKKLKACHGYLECESFANTKNMKSTLNKIIPLKPQIITPLRSKEDLNGFLVFSKKLSGKDFTNSEYQFMTFIGEAAGIAMENARLYEMATTDRMSALYIHHYFKNRLLEEFHRAKRHETDLALVMIDIDDFKKINDTYGHQCGDEVIKKIADTIKNGIRQIDIAARYGGEEFAIILPATKIEHAKAIAERLRNDVSKLNLSHNSKKFTVTASFGIATLNEKIFSAEELIEAADNALYTSKRSGKNQVTIAQAD